MITFIIPTIGRKTLERTLKSIETQTNDNWKAIVIFDGVHPTVTTTNPRITILETRKLGEGKNSAGNVRNYGMKFADTEWIGFVDDDDVISPDFVDTFYAEINEFPSIDVVIFRMYRHSDQRILPTLQTKNFIKSQVGISFVIKTDLFRNGYTFTPGKCEDYALLNKLRRNGVRIMISPFVTYFVRGDVATQNMTRGNRVFVPCLRDKPNLVAGVQPISMISWLGAFVVVVFVLVLVVLLINNDL